MHPWFKKADVPFPGQASRGYQDPPGATRTYRPPTETYRESRVASYDFGNFCKRRRDHDGVIGVYFFALKCFEML
jgi:hypothetical protein